MHDRVLNIFFLNLNASKAGVCTKMVLLKSIHLSLGQLLGDFSQFSKDTIKFAKIIHDLFQKLETPTWIRRCAL